MENLTKISFDPILDKLEVEEQNAILKLIALNDLQAQKLKACHVVFKDVDLLIKRYKKFDPKSVFATDFYKVAEDVFGIESV